MAVRLYSFVLAAALAVLVESRGIAECDLNLANHPSKACGPEVIWFGLNSTQIQEILNVHASNGESLSWSNALADRAQAYVNQCGDKSNACSIYDGSQFSISKDDSESSVSLTDMINAIYAHESFDIPEINIPDINIPEINIPDINIPEFKIPDFNMPDIEFTDMDFAKMNIADIGLSELDFPANDMPGADVSDIYSYRRRRSVDENNAVGTVGCGFIMYKTPQGGISKHLSCYYEDENGQGFK